MKCKHCGEKMVRTPDKILTTNPPMYEYTCPKCHTISYQETSIVDTDEIGDVAALPNVPFTQTQFRLLTAKQEWIAEVASKILANCPYPYVSLDGQNFIPATEFAAKQAKQMADVIFD